MGQSCRAKKQGSLCCGHVLQEHVVHKAILRLPLGACASLLVPVLLRPLAEAQKKLAASLWRPQELRRRQEEGARLTHMASCFVSSFNTRHDGCVCFGGTPKMVVCFLGFLLTPTERGTLPKENRPMCLFVERGPRTHQCFLRGSGFQTVVWRLHESPIGMK